jgi:hypothetical protein
MTMDKRLEHEIREYVDSLLARAIVINVHPSSQDAERLCRIETLLGKVFNMEVSGMALQQDIIDAVTAETTAVDAFIVYVKSLIANNTITNEAGQKILADMAANRAKLDPAILANT